MKNALILILVSSIFTFSLAQESAPKAEKSLKESVRENSVAGVTGGFATAEEILWIGYEGFADKEEGTSVDATTIFRMASIAKSITAIGIMQLVEKGKLDLDQPIAEYLSTFPIRGGAKISVRHLLNHSSGISAYESSKETENKIEYPSLMAAIEFFANRELNFEPGSKYGYSTYGYVVLGWVLEEVSGMSYESYVKDNILSVAGMQHTGIEKFNEPIENASKLYTQKNRDPKTYSSSNNKTKEKKRTNLSNRIPGGGFYTTAEDLLKFGQAILNNSLVNESSRKLMWTNGGLKKEGNPYGFGWFIYGEHPEYGNVYGHSGGQTGASCQLMIMPDENLITVIMSNTSHTWEHVFGKILNFPNDARVLLENRKIIGNQ